MQPLLLLVILCSWFLLTIAPASRLAIEDAQRGTPIESRRGVSIFPGFPAFPLFIWGAGWALATWWLEGIAVVLLYSHLGLALVSAFIIVRDILRLRSIRSAHS